MARYDCTRCGVTCFTTDGPHLCKDVAKRLKRRQAQVDAVLAILTQRVVCGCAADTELCMGPGCVVCKHRDHGPDGCRVSVIKLGRLAMAEAIVAKLSQMGVTDD